MGGNADMINSGSEGGYVQANATTPVARPSSSEKGKVPAKSGGNKSAREVILKDRSPLTNDRQGPSSKAGKFGANPGLMFKEVKQFMQATGSDTEALNRAFKQLMQENDIETNDEEDEETDLHADGNGLFYCLKHQREVCRDCFQNHSAHNNIIRANDSMMKFGDMGPMKACIKKVLDELSDDEDDEKSLDASGKSQQPSVITYVKKVYSQLRVLRRNPSMCLAIANILLLHVQTIVLIVVNWIS